MALRNYEHNGATWQFDDSDVPDGAVEVKAAVPANKAVTPEDKAPESSEPEESEAPEEAVTPEDKAPESSEPEESEAPEEAVTPEDKAAVNGRSKPAVSTKR
jgi:hypothetical protein